MGIHLETEQGEHAQHAKSPCETVNMGQVSESLLNLCGSVPAGMTLICPKASKYPVWC